MIRNQSVLRPPVISSTFELRTSKFAVRSAFTLVEMLVVVGIIGILVSITAAAAFQILAYSRVSNTETLIRTLDKALQQQWSAVVAQAKKETVPQEIINLATPPSPPNPPNTPPIPGLATVIWVKLRLAQEFPMNFSEALNGITIRVPAPPPAPPYTYTMHPLKSYVAYLSQNNVTSQTIQNQPQNPETEPGLVDESAVLLLLSLQQARSGAGLNADDLPPGAVRPGNYRNVATLQQLTDSWGMPLVFYRWPTQNSELDAMCPAPSGPSGSIGATFRDPGDPEGTLISPYWWGTSGENVNATYFEGSLHSLQKSGSPYEYYMLPTIASRGRDAKLGLTTYTLTSSSPDGMASITDPNNPAYGADKDNIYSYRLREQARGD
jgi:prepilin-type N-terminal cleavage/methylation domain-containing protein